MKLATMMIVATAAASLFTVPKTLALGEGTKPRLAVMEFRAQPGDKLPTNCAIVLQDILISGIKSKAMGQCEISAPRDTSTGQASGRRSRGAGGTPRMIARQLGADYILTGSIRTVLSSDGDPIGHRRGRRRAGAGGRAGSGQQIIAVLIAARLVNTRTGSVAWEGQQRSEPITINGMGGMDSATFQKYAEPVAGVLIAMLLPQVK